MGKLELVIESDNVIIYSPKYDGETHTEFEKFFSRSVDAILRIYLRGTDRQALIEEVENYK